MPNTRLMPDQRNMPSWPCTCTGLQRLHARAHEHRQPAPGAGVCGQLTPRGAYAVEGCEGAVGSDTLALLLTWCETACSSRWHTAAGAFALLLMQTRR